MTLPVRLVPRLLAVVALVAAAAGTGTLPSAAAAPCSAGSGVSVVVDYHQLGGGVVQTCDPAGSGKTAQRLFEDNGFALAYTQRQPGFVCRVNDKPGADVEACVNTPPSDAYWGLFWADGTSASWKYSTVGVGGLTLKAGQSVAFSWQGSGASTPPGVTPPHTIKPSASPSASDQPSEQPSGPASTSAAPSGTASADQPEASPSASRSEKVKATRSARPTATSSASDSPTASSSAGATAAASADPGAGGGTGLPGWALPAVLAGLVATGGVTAYLRRRTSGSPP